MRWTALAFGLPVAVLGVLFGACNGDNTTTPDGGDAGGNDGATDAPSDAHADQATGDAGDAALVAICSKTLTWQASQLLSISTPQSDFFGSVTPDELSIAWMTAAGTILYADRTTTASPFNAPQTLSAGAALDRVSLSSDGLTLIVVLQNRYSLAQTTRSSRSAAFSTTLDPTPFAQLDPPITEGDGNAAPVHGSFADPLLSPDGTFLYYSQYGVSTYTMTEAYRAANDTSPWLQGRNLGVPSAEKTLEAPDLSGTRCRPTGISADNLTLFFYDMSTNVERMGFRADPFNNNTYTTFVDLGAQYENAMPTTACTRIYFSSAGSGGLDLFYADKQ